MPFWGAICILKTIILPRQAWDRHDESSEQMLLFAGDGGVSGNGAPDPSAYPHYLKMQRALLATGRDIGTKTVVFVSTQLIMMKERIISPRQARDKRRENSKEIRFLAVHNVKGVPGGGCSASVGRAVSNMRRCGDDIGDSFGSAVGEFLTCAESGDPNAGPGAGKDAFLLAMVRFSDEKRSSFAKTGSGQMIICQDRLRTNYGNVRREAFFPSFGGGQGFGMIPTLSKWAMAGSQSRSTWHTSACGVWASTR